MKYDTIVITGSNGATARELIYYFSKISNNVVGIARGKKEEFDKENITVLEADMYDYNSVDTISKVIMERYQSIDVWINCVGGFSMGSSIENDTTNWKTMYDINFLTCLHGSQAAIMHMSKQGRGNIINIGSQAAIDGFPDAAPYLVSKSSVHMLTRLIALENTHNNVTANAILPGIIDTEANRKAMPDEDFSTWQTPIDIALSIERTIDSNASGLLVSVDK